jgi:hypothetical protein
MLQRGDLVEERVVFRERGKRRLGAWLGIVLRAGPRTCTILWESNAPKKSSRIEQGAPGVERILGARKVLAAASVLQFAWEDYHARG